MKVAKLLLSHVSREFQIKMLKARRHRETPLQNAITKSLSLCEYLLQAGADPRIGGGGRYDCHFDDPKDRIRTFAFYHASNGRCSMVSGSAINKLIYEASDKPTHPIELQDDYFWSDFLRAARNDDVELVEKLLNSEEVADMNEKTHYGKTAYELGNERVKEAITKRKRIDLEREAAFEAVFKLIENAKWTKSFLRSQDWWDALQRVKFGYRHEMRKIISDLETANRMKLKHVEIPRNQLKNAILVWIRQEMCKSALKNISKQ